MAIFSPEAYRVKFSGKCSCCAPECYPKESSFTFLKFEHCNFDIRRFVFRRTSDIWRLSIGLLDVLDSFHCYSRIRANWSNWCASLRSIISHFAQISKKLPGKLMTNLAPLNIFKWLPITKERERWTRFNCFLTSVSFFQMEKLWK